jgi:hypothetical protein
VGKVVQHLRSVNYHDSHTHGHERHGPFTRLVGIWLVGTVQVGSSRSGAWYAGGVSLCACFGFRWDACERWSFLAMGVTPVSLRPLITVGNLGPWSCFDVV